MNPFTDRHASNLSLLFTAQKKQIRARVPAKADAFDKRIDDDFMSPMKRTLDVLYDLRTSTRYAKPRDEQRRYAYDFTKDRLTKLRADTVDALEAQRQKREAAVLTSKKTTSDPALALVQEMQRQEVRRELRTLDPLTLSVRLNRPLEPKRATRCSPPSRAIRLPLPVAHRSSVPTCCGIRALRTRLPLIPRSGNWRCFATRTEFCLGAVEQTLLEATGLTKAEISTDPSTPVDKRQSFRVSTGEPVTT